MLTTRTLEPVDELYGPSYYPVLLSTSSSNGRSMLRFGGGSESEHGASPKPRNPTATTSSSTSSSIVYLSSSNVGGGSHSSGIQKNNSGQMVVNVPPPVAASAAAATPGGGGNTIPPPSPIRQHVPYLRDLQMSREMVVYRSHQQQQQHVSTLQQQTGTWNSSSSRFLSGASTTAAGTSLGGRTRTVGMIPATIADWDDGSSQRHANGLHGQPILVGGKPLPTITVSCEEGRFARHYYELREHREDVVEQDVASITNASVRNGSIGGVTIDDDPLEKSLTIPVWPERAATPDEIADERHFAEEAGYWDELYWQKVTASRKQLAEQQQQQQHMLLHSPHPPSTPSGGGTSSTSTLHHHHTSSATAAAGPRRSSVSFGNRSHTSSSNNVPSASQIVGVLPSPIRQSNMDAAPHLYHPASRKPSMPMLQRGGGSRPMPTTSSVSTPVVAPRWNTSQRVDNAFRREASLSSVTSSVLESQGSSTQKTRDGTLNGRRPSITHKAVISQRKATTDALSRSSASSIKPIASSPFSGPGDANNNNSAKQKQQDFPLRSTSSEALNELEGTTITDDGTATEDSHAFRSVLRSAILQHAVSSTASTIDPESRSINATPLDDNNHPSVVVESSLSMKVIQPTTITANVSSPLNVDNHHPIRVSIPWSSEWALPIAFHTRRVAFAFTEVEVETMWGPRRSQGGASSRSPSPLEDERGKLIPQTGSAGSHPNTTTETLFVPNNATPDRSNADSSEIEFWSSGRTSGFHDGGRASSQPHAESSLTETVGSGVNFLSSTTNAASPLRTEHQQQQHSVIRESSVDTQPARPTQPLTSGSTEVPQEPAPATSTAFVEASSAQQSSVSQAKQKEKGVPPSKKPAAVKRKQEVKKTCCSVM